MSPMLTTDQHTKKSFPRVSGDEPTVETMLHTVFTFSPRERG